jgi:ribosomal protein S18 acetylase RimI-like enzyme
MTETVSIRPAQASDYDSYCALISEVDALHIEREPLVFKDPGSPVRKREYFDSLLAAKDKAVFLAELDAHTVGFIHLETRDVSGSTILVTQDYAYVSDLVVTMAKQRLGVGRALMAHAEQWAKQRGLNQLRLNVRSFNMPAIKLYESVGMAVNFQSMFKRF